MKIAVFGTGGVGGYFGGLLARANQEVHFLARGAHLNAIRKDGLRVISVNGDFHIYPASATDSPAEIGPMDYVIVAVKRYHLENVASQISPLVGPQTTVVPLLNGVDAHEILIEKLGPDPVIGGFCIIFSMIEAPGVIRQTSKFRRVVVGELDRTKSRRVEKIVQLWDQSGAESIHADDIYIAMWTKFLFIASFSGITSLARANAAEIFSCPETRQLLFEAMDEVEALARAQGIHLADNVVENALAMGDALEPAATTSMQRDVVEGNMFELEAFSGKIAQLGKELGVPTPVHSTMYGLLLPSLNSAQKSSAASSV